MVLLQDYPYPAIQKMSVGNKLESTGPCANAAWRARTMKNSVHVKQPCNKNSKANNVECFLPRDILNRIFSFLSVEDIHRAALVSRQWADAARSIGSRYHLVVPSHMSDEAFAAMLMNKRRPQQIQCVNLTGCFKISDTSLALIAELCPDLQCLSIERCGSKITVKGLERIASACPRFSKLNARNCRSLCDITIELVTSMRKLTHLDVSGQVYRISDNAVIKAASCGTLKYVNISACSRITDASLLALSNCKSLTHLYMQNSKAVTDWGMEMLASKCNELVHLDVSGNRNITNASAIAIASNCSKLQVLRLNLCSNISGLGIFALVAGCKDLIQLDIAGCTLSAACYQAVLKIKPTLRIN
eukprot:Colp12_sorted_trinity150504_noHs@34287